MDQIKPIVITSRIADDHLNKIRAEHTSILEGMDAQKVKVDNFNQNRIMQQTQQAAQQAQSQKDQLEADRKMKELEIKAAALSMD